MSVEELVKELKSGGGGNFDEDIITMGDGDQLQFAMIKPPDEWGVYWRHYIQSKQNGGYKLCRGEDCEFCDAGSRAGKVTLVPVYIYNRMQAARGDFPAKRTKNVGYKFMILNKETTENFTRIYKRRNERWDRIFVMERIGDDKDTKYDIDRTEDTVKSDVTKGARKMVSTEEKFREMAEKELAGDDSSGGGKKKKRKVDDDDDDEMEDFDVDDDDDDDDEPVRRKKKTVAKKKSKVRSRR